MFPLVLWTFLLVNHSVVSDSLWPYELQPARLLCPWDFPGKNAGVFCHFLLQGLFSIQESNPCLLCLLHGRQILYHWATWESPAILNRVYLKVKVPTSAGSWKKLEFQKNSYFCFIDYAKAFDCVDHNKLWKILKQMGIPDHLTCLLRNLYAGQEATVRTGHGTTDWFQIGKGVR